MKLILSLVALLFITACDEAQNTPPSASVTAPTNTPVTSKSSETVKEVRNSATCAMDMPKNAAQVSATESLRIAGWAYDAETMTSPESVKVKLVSVSEQNSKIIAATRTKRPDLVVGTKNSGVEMAGVDLTIPANTLVPGKYDVVFLQDGPNYNVQCAKGYKIEVVDKLPPVQAPTATSEPVITPSVSKIKTKKAKKTEG
jgi:hypothetical protein